MKRMMITVVVFLLAFASVSVSLAFDQKEFWRNRTGKFISWADLAQQMKVSEAKIKALAPVNRDQGLKPGEWTAAHDLGIGSWFGWFYHLGDDAKVGLAGQAKGLPNDIRPTVEALIQNKAPVREIRLKWGQHLAWMGFQKGRKPQFFKNAVCLWLDPKSGQVVSEVTAYVWEGTNLGYAAGCFNLFALAETPKPAPVPTAAPKPNLVVPTAEPTVPPTAAPIKAPVAEKVAAPFLNPSWGEGVLWLVPEYVRADQLTQFNFYGGLEWRRKLSSRWWWVLRGEVGPGWNFPDEGIDTSAQTSTLRTGIRYRLIDKGPVALDFEAGVLGWIHSEHYDMFKWDNGPSDVEGDASKVSGGGYVRLLGKSKAETYYEIEYRNAGLESAYAGNLSTEPGRFYAEVGGGASNYSELDDEGLIYRQEGDFSEWHARAGYKLMVTTPLILSVTCRSWNYDSDIWRIRWNAGFGAHIEYRPDTHLRIQSDWVHFGDREDGPPGEIPTKSHEDRVQLGLTYAW